MNALLKLLGVLAIVAAVEGGCWFGRRQKYKVKMELFCGDQPADNIQVKLKDYDTGPSIDDHMAAGRTDSRGRLELSGEECELGNIDPRVDIYHDCNDVHQKTGIPKPCQRKWKVTLPKKPYINGEAFNMGRINLEMKLKDEDRDCIH